MERWLSLYESILGPKLRVTAKAIGCSQNEVLGLLNRLWIWSLDNADKDGLIIGADEKDLEDVLSTGKSRSLNAEKAVAALISEGWIEKEGDKLTVHNWFERQKYFHRLNDKLENDREKKRIERKKKILSEKAGKTENEKGLQQDLSKEETNTSSKPAKQVSRKNDYPKEFEEFWSVYPRKIDKGNAYKKFKARINDGYSANELIDAARNYRKVIEREHTEEKFIKHPKSFLSDAMPFADYLPKKSNNEQKFDNDDPYAGWRN